MSSPRLSPLQETGSSVLSYLIAIDLDGTLLAPDHHISAPNAAALRQARRQGHEIVIATGRSEEDARILLHEIAFDCPVISANGALTTDANGQVLRRVPLARESVEMLLPRTADQDWYVELYTQQGTYVLPRAAERLHRDEHRFLTDHAGGGRAHDWKFAQSHLDQNGIVPVPSFQAVLEDPAQVLLKLLAFTFSEANLRTLARDVEQRTALTVTQSSPYDLEFSHPEAQKGAALVDLARRLDWPMSRTMAIGDSANDLSMMRVSGHAVAMGGAHESIRTACRSVTRRCEDDGVAHALDGLLGSALATD